MMFFDNLPRHFLCMHPPLSSFRQENPHHESGDVISSFKHAISEQLLASACRENFEIYNMQYYI